MHRQIESGIIFIVMFLTMGGWVCGQEADAIRQLEEIGGRISQIAADSEDLEVSLYLAGKTVTDEHVELLADISNVKWLNLANTSVTDEGLSVLVERPLNRLHLEKTGIGDDGLVHLKDLSELEYLNLYGTQVTNEGLKHLAGLKKLRKLYVWQSKVDQEGIEWLTSQLPDLEVVGAVSFDAQPEESKEAGKESEGEGK